MMLSKMWILGFCCIIEAPCCLAQTVHPESIDDTTLRQIIIFGRHGVRSPAAPSAIIDRYTSTPYPTFGVPVGYLTAHGKQAEVLLGSYYRAYLLHEQLLTGNDADDVKDVYFRANSIQRSNASAAALAHGLLPNAVVDVHSFPLGHADPVFDPIAANLVRLDADRATREIAGIFGPNGSVLTRAYSAEFSIVRNALASSTAIPPSSAEQAAVDPTDGLIPLTAKKSGAVTGGVIDTGALANTLYAADPFIMEYAEGLPINQVAWGRLSLDQLSQQTRIITLYMAIEMSAPYLNKLQSSNAAAHILRSMQRVATGRSVRGGFGNDRARVVIVNSSDAYVIGMASLLRLHWQLPGYQPDYCPPGGSLVIELREVKRTHHLVVRVYFTAQTLDQLRDLSPLTIDAPPASVQLLIPDGDETTRSLDVSFERFGFLVSRNINFRCCTRSAN